MVYEFMTWQKPYFRQKIIAKGIETFCIIKAEAKWANLIETCLFQRMLVKYLKFKMTSSLK